MTLNIFFKRFVLSLVFTLFISQLAYANLNSEIKLVINGNPIVGMESPPVILDGYTMVPARDVFEPLGAVINWNPGTQSVYIGYLQDLIILETNNNAANINGTSILMDTEAKIINDKVMIPVRFVAESLGFDVTWNEDTMEVHINTNIEDINQVINTPNPVLNYNFPQTRITNIHIPEPTAKHDFIIEATSEISEFEYFMVEDDRLVVDISNANMNLTTTQFVVEDSPNVSGIRVAQNEIEPVQITRIVFEIRALSNYNVTLSEDRKRLYVTFEENIISNINVNSSQEADYVQITGTNMPVVNIESDDAGNSLILDIPNAKLEGMVQPTINGRFIRQINASQYNENTVRIIINIDQRVNYNVSHNNNITTVRIGESTFRNIRFNYVDNTIVINKNNNNPINTSSIIHNDDYHNGRYVFTLPGDYSAYLGYGEISVNNEFIDSISIATEAANTNIIINQNKITAPYITESNENIYIHIREPKEVYSKIIMLDPGHGGHDPGAVHFGVSEKDITLSISNIVNNMFENNNDIKVYTTRTTDVFVPLAERSSMSNEVADLFVSIHLNAVANNNVVRGTEVYYIDNNTDHMYNINRKEVADLFQANLIEGLNTVDRGVKTANFAVLRNTNMPSVLLELGFLTNPEENAMFVNPQIQQQTAEIIYNTIVEIFNVYTPPRS